MPDNCYQVLGVSRSASRAEIRAAFVREVKRHHPDATSANRALHTVLPQRLQDIQAAYRVLSDPVAQAAHDRSLEAADQRYLDHQRAVRRRLRHYDRRHPHPVPRTYRRVRWRPLTIMALLFAIAGRLGLRLLS